MVKKNVVQKKSVSVGIGALKNMSIGRIKQINSSYLGLCQSTRVVHKKSNWQDKRSGNKTSPSSSMSNTARPLGSGFITSFISQDPKGTLRPANTFNYSKKQRAIKNLEYQKEMKILGVELL